MIAGGTWAQAGGKPVNNIAAWDGTKWSALAEGIGPGWPFDHKVITLGVFNGAGGPELFAAGQFGALAGSVPAAGLARWAPCGVSCFADANGDGGLDIDDFVHFQTQYATGNPGSDCTQEGELTIDDFLCFQTVFAVGC